MIKKLSKLMQNVSLPPDILGGSLISLSGRCELYIENCIKIAEYETDSVKLRLSDGTLHIRGENFVLNSFGNGSVKIKGIINSIEFCE